MFVKLYPENPNPRDVTRIAGILRGDGVIIYPTDGVYAFGCSLASQKAIERLKTIRGKRDDESHHRLRRTEQYFGVCACG